MFDAELKAAGLPVLAANEPPARLHPDFSDEELFGPKARPVHTPDAPPPEPDAGAVSLEDVPFPEPIVPSPTPEFEPSDVPGPERAPIREPGVWDFGGPEFCKALDGAPDGVRNDPESAAVWWEKRLESVPVCFHCNKRHAMYCNDCYHERYDRKTELGTAHKSPSGYFLLTTRWCTQGNRKREGYETIDGIVTAWSQYDPAATFFVFEHVESEEPGTYRAYVYSREG